MTTENVPELLSEAIVHHREGRIAEALALGLRILDVDPNHPLALNLTGVALFQSGEADKAMAMLHQATVAHPQYVEAHCNLANVLRAMGRLGDALGFYQKALAIRPDYADAHNNIGSVLRTANQSEAAEAAFRRTLEIDSDHLTALDNLGELLRDAGRTEEAREVLQHSLAVRDTPGTRTRLALLTPVISRSTGHIDEVRRNMNTAFDDLIAAGPRMEDPLGEVGATNFYLAYHGRDDRALQEKIAGFFLGACPALAWTALHCRRPPAPTEGRRIRVGIASTYLRRHTIGKLNRGLIENLSRERFHLTLIRASAKHDAMAAAMDGTADAVVPLPIDDLQAARETIAGLELDVLFYLDVGMDPLTYYLAFARLAPVQCVAWGHPDTTGIPNLDYFLSSELVEPPGAEAHYSEHLVRLAPLPTCYSRPAPPGGGADRQRFDLPDDATLYVCPQNLFKFHPDFDAALAALLGRDPRGLLVFIAAAHSQWTGRFRDRFAASFGTLAERMVFLPRMPEDDFLRLLLTADALIDPPYFSGGNTSLEAFALGVPIVTWDSPFMRGRVTHGCYKAMGIDALVADGAEAFVELAVRLANDPAWHGEMSRLIRERSGALFDNAEAVRAFEEFFIAAIPA